MGAGEGGNVEVLVSAMCVHTQESLYLKEGQRYIYFIIFSLLPLQKFWDISRQIHDFMTWKQVECPFEKDKKIQSYLLTAPIYSEEGKKKIFQSLLKVIQALSAC